MNLTCTNFYDVKYWEGLVAIGTIFTAFFAYKSINQSNKDSMLAQKPFVVFQDRIYLNSSNEVSGISLKNIGIGLAYNITLSVRALDTSNDFIDKSNPKVIHLSPNETHSMWALDNNKLLASLRSVGMKGNNIINMTNSATLRLFVHYYDSFSNEYVTEATFKRSGNFIKVVDLDYWGMKEI